MPITNRHRNKHLPSQREWQERTRQKIRDAGTVDKALKVLDGTLKMDPSQVVVLKALLPTILPTQSESSVEQIVHQIPDLQGMKKMLHGNPELLEALGLQIKPVETLERVEPKTEELPCH